MGDFYEVVLRGSYAGQEVINRWNYTIAGTLASVTGSFALASAFGTIPDVITGFPSDGLFQAIRNIQAASTEYIELVVKEIWDEEDFYTNPFDTGTLGSVSGAGAPGVDAIGFRTNRVTRAIRRGTKRFVGVPQGWIGDTGSLTGGATQIAALATLMAANITYDDEGNTITFTPAVAGKEKYHPASNPTGWAYKYYGSWALQSPHVAQGFLWQPYDNVRSQTSRQLGRGA